MPPTMQTWVGPATLVAARPSHLIDYASNNAGMNNATFQTANLNIIDTGTNAARLYWDDATDAVKLSINETVTWTGAGGNNLLTNAANWDTPDGKAPIANDTLLINNGDTVAHAQNLPVNATINLVGSELTTDGAVIRLNNATINVDAASTLSGAFWDLDGASIVFEDGAQATMANWEQKDINSFTYELGAYDFTTLTPDRFLIGNGGLTGDIANATYIADFSNFANWSSSQSRQQQHYPDGFYLDGAGMDNHNFKAPASTTSTWELISKMQRLHGTTALKPSSSPSTLTLCRSLALAPCSASEALP